ncbi:MAG: Hpt domain-containing protein [Nannocystaceae bacterium]
MNSSVIVVSPSPQLCGLVIDAAGELEAAQRPPLIVAPTLLEGRVFTEILRPRALLVDAGFGADGQRSLAAAAAAAAAPAVLLGECEAPGFDDRVAAERSALVAWLAALEDRVDAAPPADDMLAVVRARYARSLGEKAATLAAHAWSIIDGVASAEAIEEARRLAHRLRGSAGSYGFPAFGEIAAGIDAALLGGLVSPPPSSLRRAAEILALWRRGADPLAEPWPALAVAGGHALAGELAPLAQAAGCRVELARGDGRPAALVRVVERGAGEAEGAAMVVSADEVELRGEGRTFPRDELARRLPELLTRWRRELAS